MQISKKQQALPVRTRDQITAAGVTERPMIIIIIRALWLTQRLTEMSTRNLPGDKTRPARKEDNVIAIWGRLSRKCGILDVSQH
jgi:hypothetical protein